ncbi:hypothetical protein DFH27DRAFT_546134 [Peziza echinospora]|nr:hypothetical protein DFH27DRAFT_546134 [Peziza echinospora]
MTTNITPGVYAGGAASGPYEHVDGDRGEQSTDNTASGRGSPRSRRGRRPGGSRTAGRGGGGVAAVGAQVPGSITNPTPPPPPQQQLRKYTPIVDQAKVVRRPLPDKRNSRQFQLSQLRRRFGLKDTEETPATTEYPIDLAPSDPEFPYEIDVLNLLLTVPLGYGGGPGTADGKAGATVHTANQPSIQVLNADIPLGFKVNIESGFRDIAKNASESTTLLDMLNSLDKRLEGLLAEKKATTIKIIPNAPSKTAVTSSVDTVIKPQPAKPHVAAQRPAAARFKAPAPLPAYTKDQVAAALAKREQDVRQLEARLGRLEIFQKHDSPDGGLVFTVPLDPRRKDLLPVPLQTIRSVRLRVPRLFDLEPCTVEFTGIPGDIGATLQRKFTKQVEGNPKWTLMAHLNSLAANLHAMATEALGEEAEEEAAREKQQAEDGIVRDMEEKAIIDESEVKGLLTTGERPSPAGSEDKPHIVVISRPPEWSYVSDSEGDSDTGDGSDYESESEGEDEIGDGGNEPGEGGAGPSVQSEREHGTALSFPGIQLSGIQLLQVLVINVTVKCTKCKTDADVMNIRPGGKPRYDACVKCSSVYGVGFRMEPVHQFSNRAGFFDLVGCKIADILPSNFLPHCESCDTPLPPPGISGLVPGQTVSTNCRQCHHKMSIFIPEMKLLRISQDDDLVPHDVRRKKTQKDRFVAGTELPDRGRCSHYKKSTRWFRFACCQKVFPCDKCHDEQANPPHPCEFGSRMICGRCSREQNFRPNDCAYCGHSYVGRNTGYWEGGKGTRSRLLLRKNDSRKKKRIGRPLAPAKD